VINYFLAVKLMSHLIKGKYILCSIPFFSFPNFFVFFVIFCTESNEPSEQTKNDIYIHCRAKVDN
jgi:hypothetical protein